MHPYWSESATLSSYGARTCIWIFFWNCISTRWGWVPSDCQYVSSLPSRRSSTPLPGFALVTVQTAKCPISLTSWPRFNTCLALEFCGGVLAMLEIHWVSNSSRYDWFHLKSPKNICSNHVGHKFPCLLQRHWNRLDGCMNMSKPRFESSCHVTCSDYSLKFTQELACRKASGKRLSACHYVLYLYHLQWSFVVATGLHYLSTLCIS